MEANLKSSVLSISKTEHFKFISTGLACHALCLLEYAGILKILKAENKIFSSALIKKYKNPSLLKTACTTLIDAEVLAFENNVYNLTELGLELADNIGSIMLPFMGYRNLFVKQFDLLENPQNWSEADIDFPVVAEASVNFALHDLLPVLIEIFGRLVKPKKTICDLGSGTCDKLIEICQETNCYGLGIEKCMDVVKEGEKYTENYPEIETVQGDMLQLEGVWEDVEATMINFVYHDFSLEECSKLFMSIRNSFPRSNYLVIADIVSYSKEAPTILPGFDYVHGLQGVTPRSYEETLDSFKASNLNIVEEHAIPNMPNTFVWVLKIN